MSMYQENKGVPAGSMEITVERGGEYLRLTVPEGATIQALIRDNHLRGVEVANTRVNGAPANRDTSLRAGDSVAQIPKSGEQG